MYGLQRLLIGCDVRLLFVTAVAAALCFALPALADEGETAARGGLESSAAAAKPALTVSDAIRVNGLDFQIVGVPFWPTPAAGTGSKIPLVLKLTNHTDGAVQVNMSDTIHVRMKDAAGKEVASRWIERGTIETPRPLLLAKGKSATIDHASTLYPDSQREGLLELDCPPVSGGTLCFNGLKPGSYSVYFTCENKEKLPAGIKPIVDPQQAPFWIGKAVSKELAVTIADRPAGPKAQGPAGK